MAALGLVTITAGCAGGTAEQLLVRPGRFDYLSCPEIAKASETAAKREQELKTLIDRAEKESFGVLMAGASYRGDYLQAQGEQKMLADVARQKNCAAQQSPPAASTPARR
ncbi:MAG TPA: hypothetical protein VFK79_00605 [Xanthobacteraceae bacterium]|nr:hypothetical protein [Xanthobacteraceae bacterium]